VSDLFIQQGTNQVDSHIKNRRKKNAGRKKDQLRGPEDSALQSSTVSTDYAPTQAHTDSIKNQKPKLKRARGRGRNQRSVVDGTQDTPIGDNTTPTELKDEELRRDVRTDLLDVVTMPKDKEMSEDATTQKQTQRLKTPEPYNFCKKDANLLPSLIDKEDRVSQVKTVKQPGTLILPSIPLSSLPKCG